MNVGNIVAIAAIVIAPLVGYITATRKLSGKITTSDASELWAESAALRQDYRSENERLRIQVGVLEAQLETLQKESRESIISHAVLVHAILANAQGKERDSPGLRFIGGGDGYLYAFDKKNGKEIWRGKTPYDNAAVPMTYRTRSGRQFIVVATGTGADNALVAFALGK